MQTSAKASGNYEIPYIGGQIEKLWGFLCLFFKNVRYDCYGFPPQNNSFDSFKKYYMKPKIMEFYKDSI